MRSSFGRLPSLFCLQSLGFVVGHANRWFSLSEPQSVATIHDSNARMFFVKNCFRFLLQLQNSSEGFMRDSTLILGKTFYGYKTRIADLAMVSVFNKPKLNGITAKINLELLALNINRFCFVHA